MGEYLSLTLDSTDKDQILNYAERSERLRELVAKRKAAGLSARNPRFVTELLREVEGMTEEIIPEPRFIHEATIDLTGTEFKTANLTDDLIVVNDEVFFDLITRDGKSSGLINIDGKRLNEFPCDRNQRVVERQPIIYNGRPCFYFKYLDKGQQLRGDIVDAEGKHIGDENLSDTPSGTMNPVTDENNELKAFLGKYRDIDVGMVLDLDGSLLTKNQQQYEKVGMVDGRLAYVSNNRKDKGRKLVLGNNEIESDSKLDDFSLPFTYDGNLCCLQSIFSPSKQLYDVFVNDLTGGNNLIETQIHDRHDGNILTIGEIITNGDNLYFILNSRKKSSRVAYQDVYKFVKGSHHIERLNPPDTLILKKSISNGRLVMVSQHHLGGTLDYIICGDGFSEVRFNVDDTRIVGDFNGVYSTEKPIEVLGHKGSLFYVSEDVGTPKSDRVNYLYIDNVKVEMPKGEVSKFCASGEHVFWSCVDDNFLWIDGKRSDQPSVGNWKVVYSKGKYFYLDCIKGKISIKQIQLPTPKK